MIYKKHLALSLIIIIIDGFHFVFSFLYSLCPQDNHFEGDSSPSENVRNIPIKVMEREEGENTGNQEGLTRQDIDASLTGSKNESCANHALNRENVTVSQPKVHRIPIQIESKEIPIQSQTTPFSESSPKPSLNLQSHNSVINERLQNLSPHKKGDVTYEFDHNQNVTCKGAKVHKIPIQIERKEPLDNSSTLTPVSEKSINPQTIAPLPGQSTSKKVNNGNVTSSSTPVPLGSALPHVTRIPVSMEQSSEPPSASQEANKPVQPPVLALPAKKDPLDLVKEVDNEINKLKLGVDYFNGDQRLYRWLDEMLTRCMLKLDNIDGEGRDDVKQARKAALALIDKILAELEEKVKNPPPMDEEENAEQAGKDENVEKGKNMETDGTEANDDTNENPVPENAAQKAENEEKSN